MRYDRFAAVAAVQVVQLPLIELPLLEVHDMEGPVIILDNRGAFHGNCPCSSFRCTLSWI